MLYREVVKNDFGVEVSQQPFWDDENTESFIKMEPEELAQELLMALPHNLDSDDNFSPQNLGSFQRVSSNDVWSGDENLDNRKALALWEAWHFLYVAGYIARRQDDNDSFYFVTRRGYKAISNSQIVKCDFLESMLPSTLHSDILSRCSPPFRAENYSDAIQTAFKVLEETVRLKAGLAPEIHGKQVFIDAFKANTGSLKDSSSESPAEEEGLQQLMTGAYAYFRNPNAHRTLSKSPEGAVEILSLASRLLKITDSSVKRGE